MKLKAQRKQNEFVAVLSVISRYSGRDQKYIEAKNKLLGNVKTFYKGREKIIEDFENWIFPFEDYVEDSIFKDDNENDEMK